jgi:hypothetical protein
MAKLEEAIRAQDRAQTEVAAQRLQAERNVNAAAGEIRQEFGRLREVLDARERQLEQHVGEARARVDRITIQAEDLAFAISTRERVLSLIALMREGATDVDVVMGARQLLARIETLAGRPVDLVLRESPDVIVSRRGMREVENKIAAMGAVGADPSIRNNEDGTVEDDLNRRINEQTGLFSFLAISLFSYCRSRV